MRQIFFKEMNKKPKQNKEKLNWNNYVNHVKKFFLMDHAYKYTVKQVIQITSSLAICEGYIPEKFEHLNTKTCKSEQLCFTLIIPSFPLFLVRK